MGGISVDWALCGISRARQLSVIPHPAYCRQAGKPIDEIAMLAMDEWAEASDGAGGSGKALSPHVHYSCSIIRFLPPVFLSLMF